MCVCQNYQDNIDCPNKIFYTLSLEKKQFLKKISLASTFIDLVSTSIEWLHTAATLNF